LLGVRVGSLLRQDLVQALASGETSAPTIIEADQADLFAVLDVAADLGHPAPR
jgi:hypothetical protein